MNFKTEAQLQTAVINYIRLQYPNVRYCASLGGQYQQYKKQQKKGKSTGYVAGFPDLQLTEPKGEFHGLFIELKLNKKCYASKVQKQWLNDLNDRGYKAEVTKGFEETINLIDKYLAL